MIEDIYFTDREQISDWANEAVDFLYKSKIITGTGNLEINPQKKATREETFTIIYRLAVSYNIIDELITFDKEYSTNLPIQPIGKYGDWIYYYDIQFGGLRPTKLKRCKEDGSEDQVLLEHKSAGLALIDIINDKAYIYLDVDLYETDLSFEKLKLIHNDYNYNAKIFDEKAFYREDFVDINNCKFVTADLNGENKVQLYDKYVTYYEVIGNWVYFISNNTMGKVKRDGTSYILLAEDVYSKISNIKDKLFFVYNGWIYYINNKDMHLYRVNVETTDIQKVSDNILEKGKMFFIYKDWIYYSHFTDKEFGNGVSSSWRVLYRSKLDGSKTEIVDDSDCWFIVKGSHNEIYYSNIDGYGSPFKLVKLNLDSGEKTISTLTDCYFLEVVGEWIYYTKHDRYGGVIGVYKNNGNLSNEIKVENFRW